MSSIIQVTNLSKKFIINHEGKEKYTALRDVVADKTKKIFSFSKKLKPFSKDNSKEEFWALKDINFEVQAGDRLGIIGRNGAGKSTLLKILSRITEPTSGNIKIKGRIASLLEVGTGFHPELTGRENIYLNGAILGMSRSEIKNKFDEIVAFAEVEQFLDTPVKRYSSGMYVRLAFAVAAHMEPEILVVDEVLAVGDAQFQKKCLGKMEDVSKNEGRTVLFVSHNMGIISQLCNNGILIENGKMVLFDNIRYVIDKYVSTSSMNDNLVYNASEAKKMKANYFLSISPVDENINPSQDFSFDQPIRFKFSFVLNDYQSNLQIGIGMQDKFQNRIFTILQSIDFFIKNEGNCYSSIIEMPASLIAPNTYNFIFALWTRDGQIFDLVENIGPIKLHDTIGTELSLYDGVDYGNIIINPTWKNV